MSWWAAETSPFRLSRRAADSVKIEFFINFFFIILIFRKIILFSELKNTILRKKIDFFKLKFSIFSHSAALRLY
jgi:hypothetical protein